MDAPLPLPHLSDMESAYHVPLRTPPRAAARSAPPQLPLSDSSSLIEDGDKNSGDRGVKVIKGAKGGSSESGEGKRGHTAAASGAAVSARYGAVDDSGVALVASDDQSLTLKQVRFCLNRVFGDCRGLRAHGCISHHELLRAVMHDTPHGQCVLNTGTCSDVRAAGGS